jgi:hypothetical protein
MTKPHAGAELEQARLGGRRRSLSLDSEPLGGPPYEQRFADGIGRRKLQQAPGLGWKGVQPPPEALLDALRERYPARESEPTRQVRGRVPP